MDERVLGDVPSEGSESGRRFGIYREHKSDMKMRSMTRNMVLFVMAVVTVIIFSIIYPVMQYASKMDSPSIYDRNINFTNKVKQDSVSSNCSTQIFSFGHDCTEPYISSTEDNTNLIAIQTDTTTPDIRRFDETSVKFTEESSSERELNLDEIKDFKFERSGRSNWPVVSTPYPYYKPTLISNTADFEEKGSASQETNIFAIPTDLSSVKYEESTTSRVNFTPPPFVFTPYPNFSGSYAQLSPYKVPQNNSNIIQVMKYLNTNTASERQFSDQPTVTNREKNTVMKVSGTYLMPLDKRRPGEIILASNSDNIEEARPFFNGHAYVSDPFNKYRPTNPSDINRLIPVKSSLDTGPRFRKPVSFVPTASIAVDITQPASHSDKNKYRNTGSHTVAIFHPPTVISQNPTTRLPTPVTGGQSEKPLSVVLDIYPVTVESESASADESSSPAERERGRLNPKWKPKATDRPKWRPQLHRRPTAPDNPAVKNHMIVHLNLFPNKRKPYSLIRRNRPESTTESKTTDQQDVQFESRIGQGKGELRGFIEEETKLTTQPLNNFTEVSSLNGNQPESSALERSKEEGETTMVTEDVQSSYQDEENTTQYNTAGSNPSSLIEAGGSEQNSGQSFRVEQSFEGLLQNQSTEINTKEVIQEENDTM